jgi:hypothetical protein
MTVSDKEQKKTAFTFVLPPLLTQHQLPAGSARPAARLEGSCSTSTPHTLNNCFYRTRGPLAPE